MNTPAKINHKHVFFIGLVWPEPQSSAAGIRIIQLIQFFLEQGCQVSFASAASKSAFSHPLHEMGVNEYEIKLNDSSFDAFIQQLNPDIVVFDRFVSEEQFGWRVKQFCPAAMQILDTEDIHFLRKNRHENFKSGTTFPAKNLPDYTLRELSSLVRVDFSLIISEAEMTLLTKDYLIPEAQLFYLPFLETPLDPAIIDSWTSFDERQHFVFIGNFLHEPNWQTTLVLKKEVWPQLRKLFPAAEMHIYGAYPSQKVNQLHQPKDKFLIKGRADDARETLQHYRVLLAPIPFGAGVKGKFVDAMMTGTPSVTTTVGAEGMCTMPSEWSGIIEDNLSKFVQDARLLYQDVAQWKVAQQKAVSLINSRYHKDIYSEKFLEYLTDKLAHLSVYRRQAVFQQLLNFNTLQSTKYMSLWIEEKNKKNRL